MTVEEVSRLSELYESSRTGGFGTEVKRRILIGTFVLSAGYFNAYLSQGSAGTNPDH